MHQNHTELEPRVAILETSVEALTNNVEKLVEHSEKVERSISDLTVLVTKASAPRKTDWQTIISFVFLLGTVVSAICMNAKTLVGIRIGCYTVWSLAVAWQTTMNGVEWDVMGWEEQSCLIGGIIALWTGTMVAYFDKSMWRLEQNGNAPKP